MVTDILGDALLDYQHNKYTEDIKTYLSLDEEDSIPIPYLFRTFKDMPAIEQKALSLCKGAVLDIGCGAGSHSLHLQEKGNQVTAIDFSKGAIDCCNLRGVTNTVHSNIYEYKANTYDTLLLLMNGIGIAGTLNQLDSFFTHLKSLLKPNGQILLDSSDIIYMFDEDEDGGRWIPDNSKYYGEVNFYMTYKNKKSDNFPWLYLDFNTLQRAANYNGLQCQMVLEGDHYDFLARLTL